jgi:hypothetical protein
VANVEQARVQFDVGEVRMNGRQWLAMGAVMLGCGVAGAQVRLGQPQPVPAAMQGSVNGRVVCGDTQLAARFAEVMLVPVSSLTADDQGRGGFGGRGIGGGGMSRTDLDGNFTISNVTAGDYYVIATATGYISAMDMVRAKVDAGADQATLLAALPQVHVAAGAPSTVNLSLDRGGVIAGRIVWDDGSPAGGVQVNAVLQPATTTTSVTASNNVRLPGFGGFAGSGFGTADDRGQFRLTGLAPGSYLVEASVTASMPGGSGGNNFMRGFRLVLYAPGKIRKTDAKAISVGPGEERDDVSFTLDLRALHTVTGHVAAVSGPAVQSGSVRVVDAVDSTLTRTAQVNADGSFTLSYMPEGTYTLTATGSTQASNSNGRFGRGGGGSTSSTSGGTFQAFSESLSVSDTDVSGVAINLAPASSQ